MMHVSWTTLREQIFAKLRRPYRSEANMNEVGHDRKVLLATPRGVTGHRLRPGLVGQLSPNFSKQIGGVGRKTSEVSFYIQKSACHFTPLPKKRDCGSFQSLALVKVSWATRRRSSSTEERFERRDESALVGVVPTKQRHRSTKRHRFRSHLEGRW
jgi:hypothetical protein